MAAKGKKARRCVIQFLFTYTRNKYTVSSYNFLNQLIKCSSPGFVVDLLGLSLGLCRNDLGSVVGSWITLVQLCCFREFQCAWCCLVSSWHAATLMLTHAPLQPSRRQRLRGDIGPSPTRGQQQLSRCLSHATPIPFTLFDFSFQIFTF